MKDRVNRPAAAYHAVVALLDPGYFQRRPPTIGVLIQVTSRQDQCATEWYVDTERAKVLVPRLQQRRDLIVQVTTYELRDAA